MSTLTLTFRLRAQQFLRDYKRVAVTLIFLFLLVPFCACGKGSNGKAVFCQVPSGGGLGCGAPVNSGSEFLYATSNSHGGEILAFPIDPNSGALGGPTSSAAPIDASGIASSQHKFLYVSDGQTGINAFSIDQSTGVLSLVPGSPFSTFGLSHFSPVALVAAPTAVYANDSNGVTGFMIGTTGTLTPIVGSPYAGGLSGQTTLGQLNTTPVNTFLYATNPSDPNGAISVFRIADLNSGILTPVIGNFTTGPSSGPNSIVLADKLSPPIVFVALENARAMAAFVVDVTTGTLTPVHGSPFAKGFAPRSLSLSARQTFLYSIDNDELNAYSISGDGVLAQLRGFPLPLSSKPGSIAVGANDSLYVSLPDLNEIEGFSINPTDGSLAPMQSSPFAALAPELLSIVQIPVS